MRKALALTLFLFLLSLPVKAQTQQQSIRVKCGGSAYTDTKDKLGRQTMISVAEWSAKRRAQSVEHRIRRSFRAAACPTTPIRSSTRLRSPTAPITSISILRSSIPRRFRRRAGIQRKDPRECRSTKSRYLQDRWRGRRPHQRRGHRRNQWPGPDRSRQHCGSRSRQSYRHRNYSELRFSAAQTELRLSRWHACRGNLELHYGHLRAETRGNTPLTNGEATCVLFSNPSAMGLSGQITLLSA